MGDKGSEIRIFLADTGEEVAMAKDAQIHLSPTEEPEQEPSVWSPHSYEITGTMTIPPEEAEHFRKFIEDMKFSRKELRKMFHAVTHGQAIVFVGHFNAEGNEPFEAPVCIDRPSVLRKALAIAHNTRFQYAIVPADCCTRYVHLHL